MSKITLFDAQGEQKSQVDFDESIFGERVLTKTLREVVVAYGRNKRQGNAHTKTRAEVSGANRKMWKQKGTGRARAGDRRPPHWRSGGIAHGPRSRSWYRPIPARLRRTALNSALLSKFKDGEVSAVEGFDFKDGPKTSAVAKFLKTSKTEGSTLFAVSERDENFLKSVRNIQRVKISRVSDLNAYDIMRHSNLVLSPGALDVLKKGVGSNDGGDE